MESLLEAVARADVPIAGAGRTGDEAAHHDGEEEFIDLTAPAGALEDRGQAAGMDETAISPWARDYKSPACGFRQPTIRDKVYTFLISSSLNELRAMGRETKTKHSGVKNAVICYLLLNAQKAVARGDVDWDGFFQGRMRRFWSLPGNVSTQVRCAPSEDSILAFTPGTAGKASKVAAMSPHEFARLIGVITEQSGLPLTRIQQQRRTQRDEFWESIIARLHNDEAVVVSMNYAGLIDADENQAMLNPNLKVPQRRSGAWLKERYFGARSLFTRAYHNWSQSGQNNSEGCDFHKFVPRAPSCITLSLQGRFCVILFHALRCGTESEDTEVLTFTSKNVPHGAGYDDDDSGSEQRADRGGNKRKRLADDMGSCHDCEGISAK